MLQYTVVERKKYGKVPGHNGFAVSGVWISQISVLISTVSGASLKSSLFNEKGKTLIIIEVRLLQIIKYFESGAAKTEIPGARTINIFFFFKLFIEFLCIHI